MSMATVESKNRGVKHFCDPRASARRLLKDDHKSAAFEDVTASGSPYSEQAAPEELSIDADERAVPKVGVDDREWAIDGSLGSPRLQRDRGVRHGRDPDPASFRVLPDNLTGP